MTERDRTRYALFVLFLINLLNFYDRQILAAVTEPIRREWLLSDTAMGWLGTAFTLFYAAVGLPLGRWADRGARPRILGIGVAVWSVCTAASGFAWNYASLFAARMGVGFGEASCAPAANSLIGDLFPPARRARAISIFMLGLPLGLFLSSVVSGIVAKSYGWRMTFFVATVPGLLLAVLALRIADTPREAMDAADAATRSAPIGGERFWRPYARLLRIPTLRWIVLSGVLHNFNAYAVAAFMPAYLGRYHGLDLRAANVVSGVMLGAVGIVSLVAGGAAADWAWRRRRDGRLVLGSAAMFLGTPLIYFALRQEPGHIATFMLLMGTGWMLFYMYYATVYAAVHDVVPRDLRGTAMSFYFFWMYVLGGAFGTPMLGALSDRLARAAAQGSAMTEQSRATGLHGAFFIVPCVSLLLALVLFAASRSVGRDAQAVQGRVAHSPASSS